LNTISSLSNLVQSQLEFLAGNFVADVAGFAVVSDLEGLERHFARIDFVVAAGFGQARIERPYFSSNASRWAMAYLVTLFKCWRVLFQVRLDLVHFLAVLVDVK
jgi:hypothetical protein